MSFDLTEECGVFGVSLENPSEDIFKFVHLGLFSLQHRGQESCGVAYKKNGIEVIKSKGLVSEDFSDLLPDNTPSSLAIGHVRYSTCGASNLVNAQPLLFSCNKGDVAIAHNGNLPNSDIIKNQLIEAGAIFQTTSDSELLIHLLSRIPGKSFDDTITTALKQLDGAYSMLVINGDTLTAFRDKLGFRPLCFGKINGGYVFSSETAALDIIGATDIEFVKPGEIIFCTKGKIVKREFFATASENTQCVFELIYFARPDSYVFEESVYQFRLKAGEKLADRRIRDTDLVIPVPDSGNSAALGFSRKSGIPFDFGLMRNHYTGRSFIKPGQKKREDSVKIKLNPIKSVIKGKTLSVIDDSLVRGTTSKKIVKMLRDAGAVEVHMYLSSPEIVSSCYFGINTPTKEELISSNNSPEEIARIIGADSVTFLSLGDLKNCLTESNKYCYACFTGKYPIKIEDEYHEISCK